jgi:hypothetical protein
MDWKEFGKKFRSPIEILSSYLPGGSEENIENSDRITGVPLGFLTKNLLIKVLNAYL